MPNPPLHFVVKGFENGHALLKIGDATIQVPRADLPDTAKIGDVLAADFYFAHTAKKRQENLAKAILEEILGEEK